MSGAEHPSHPELRRLAAAHHISDRWQDVHGQWHDVPDPTLRALLEAMDVPAESDAAVLNSLDAIERAPWQRAMPPVKVVCKGEASSSVVLRLPAALDHEALDLEILREDGSTDTEPLVPSRLEPLERTTLDGEARVARHLRLPSAPPGYHAVRLLRRGDPIGTLSLVVAPDRCYEPQALGEGRRVWGLALQLYALRSQRNWGIGDFSDLEHLLAQCARCGASFVGTNPLHALFPENPAHASPYSPSDRLFLNMLYLDPERIEDFAECEPARTLVRSAEFQKQLADLREAQLVRYPAVAEAKLRVLAALYQSFRRSHLDRGTARARAFREFQRQGGRALELHAAFNALQESLKRTEPGFSAWPTWPSEYRDPESMSVRRFCREGRTRIEFFQYLHWQAERQLAAVRDRSRGLGLELGLYGDLAVSMDRGGAEGWVNQRHLARAVSVGAPPDEYNPAGQDWGLPAYVPDRLAAAGYAPFIALLRANMRHNGALRIDHVMGLERLYWIPHGASPREGAYVTYPLEDLLGIVALESHRNACAVVGEDLGTVSETVRTGMERHGVFSYRLLYFERESDGTFKTPASYPAQALCAATTHDLPTLTGFWEGRDLAVRTELGLYPREELRQTQIVERAQARAQLLLALEREGLLPAGLTIDPVSVPSMTPALARAVYQYVARTPAKLLAVQLEDILGALEQVNLPGTTEQYPNWQRKVTLELELLSHDERFVRLCETLSERGRPPVSLPSPKPKRRRAIIPRATYRVQLHAGFTFRDATALVPYLADLGVSHLYCSPYVRARPGSLHGYDIVDHNCINPEIGTGEDLEQLVSALRARGMGHILDFVPNHVGIMGADNAWWLDVLENGEASIYADFFDIDWQSPDPALAEKLLVPVLGDSYGNVLERGELTLRFECDTGSLSFFYHEHRFPLDPREYPRVLERALSVLRRDSLPESEREEVSSLVAAFGHLPDRRQRSPDTIAERHRDKEVHKRRLARLCSRNPELTEAIQAATRAFCVRPGDAESFEALHGLLESQAYRLAYWRVAADEINYRRFFEINDLAALRMENEAVFEATHALVLELIADGKVDGLRIDHPDGLYDPAQYVRRLQSRVGSLRGTVPAASVTQASGSPEELPIYLVVEKITAGFEHLPEDWPVHGTTGYRFVNVANGLLVDESGKSRLDRIYRAFLGEHLEWHAVAYESKRLIVGTSLAAELNVLANQLARIARSMPRTRDFTLNGLRQALAEIIAGFPVYRTYIAEGISPEDHRYIEWALASARRRGPALDAAVYDFVRDVLFREGLAAEPSIADAARAFAQKFQQVTSPVAAKGVEDTALYRFNRLASLNEVGGDPDAFGISVRAFHADAQYRARHWPHELLASSTHDTKRSEDVRARIDVISEMPREWRRILARWGRMNRPRKRTVDDLPSPSPNDEYLIYQTLIGTLPLEEGEDIWADYTRRIGEYMVKAVREEKQRSSWSRINSGYEEALKDFIQGSLEPRPANLFLTDLLEVGRKMARFGLLNSLSQTLCKLTAPGVPDIYQGTEMWDFSMVDPDNRRPVDYSRRRRVLEELKREVAGTNHGARGALASLARALCDSLVDGRAKLYAIWRVLQLRHRHEALFTHGEYVPLRTAGARSRHLCAFARRYEQGFAVTVVPRLYSRLSAAGAGMPLGEVWGDTWIELPQDGLQSSLVNVLDGETVSIGEVNGKRALSATRVFAHFPVALLTLPAAD